MAYSGVKKKKKNRVASRVSYTIFFIFIFSIAVGAQIEFSASVENNTVTLGEQVMVTVRIVSPKKLPSSATPQIPPSSDFDIIRTNQNQSQSSSIQFINGKVSQKNEFIYNYYYFIAPKKSGQFTFPALSLTVDNQTYSTQPFTITVTQSSADRSDEQNRSDVTVTITSNKRNCYIGEQIILIVTVSKRAQSAAQFIEQGFTNFFQTLEQAISKDFSYNRLFSAFTGQQETVNGELRHVFRMRYSLFPLNAGNISIGPISMEYIENQRIQGRRRIDPFFDDFFGESFFGASIRQVPKSILSNSLSLTVSPLPSAQPPGFSGAVGQFTLTASVNKNEVPAAEAVTLKVILQGNTRAGSLTDITLPAFPGIDVFSPEKQLKVDTTQNGLKTTKTYKYLLIPRQEGTMVLPPISWIYFDPQKATYRTLTTDPITLTVTPGKTGTREQTRYLTQEDVRLVGHDIRYLKTNSNLKNIPVASYKQKFWYLLYSIPVIITVLSLLYKIQLLYFRKNVLASIRQRAFRKAITSLASTKKKVHSLSLDQYLGTLAATIENYISEKFDIAASGKTLEELRGELIQQIDSHQAVENVVSFLAGLDAYRFGGTTLDNVSKERLASKAEEAIKEMDRHVKKEKKK